MEIVQHILDILEEGTVKENLFYLPDRRFERKTYLAVNKVLEYLGGKWNRKEKAHIFESDISDAIDDVLLTGKVIDKKQVFQFFETPLDVVKQLITLAEISSTHTCLEPSAGRGNLASAMREIVDGKSIMCIELMPENAQILVKKGFSVYKGDFLQCTFDKKFDRIVMNPPFTRQQDITHVEKALTHLNDGGILVSVMSAGVLFRQNNKTRNFWGNLKQYTSETIELPKCSFKLSGTMVNAIILKVINRTW